MATGQPMHDAAARSRVELIDTGSPHSGPDPGIALCLSGGGYHTMVFHVGALWRLNGAGLLGKLDRISNVPGGSITARVLGLHWSHLAFDATGVEQRFHTAVVEPIRLLAGRTIDATAIVAGTLLPESIGDKIRLAYRKHPRETPR